MVSVTVLRGRMSERIVLASRLVMLLVRTERFEDMMMLMSFLVCMASSFELAFPVPERQYRVLRRVT